MIFLHQANEWTIQSLVRRCWLNALGATVNWFTGGIAFGHSVMAITGAGIVGTPFFGFGCRTIRNVP
jgi:hypothetical protein